MAYRSNTRRARWAAAAAPSPPRPGRSSHRSSPLPRAWIDRLTALIGLGIAIAAFAWSSGPASAATCDFGGDAFFGPNLVRNCGFEAPALVLSGPLTVPPPLGAPESRCSGGDQDCSSAASFRLRHSVSASRSCSGGT